jgi:hypothetical protein
VETDTSNMATAELLAHYKRVSHIGDCAFFRDHCSNPQLAAQADRLYGLALGGELNKRETLRLLTALQDSWRRLPVAP